MNIKNYTSTVPVINSINKIEFRLAQAGATHIAKSYAEDKSGRPTGMIFQIPINGVPLTFRLPAKAEKVYEWMKKQRRSLPTRTQDEAIKLQADKTAWKILSDWVDIQVSLIQMQQAEPAEVFLPYYYDPAADKTLYEKVKDNTFKLLEVRNE